MGTEVVDMDMEVLTLGEFMERWENGEDLIAPCDFPHEGNPGQLGVIVGMEFRPVTFSNDARIILKVSK